MKKKLLTITAISMLAALAIPMGASAIYREDGNYTAGGDENQVQVMLTATETPTPAVSQDKALGAYSMLMKAFGEHHNAVYPETYGGAYIDGSTLVILLTDMSAADQYKEICGEYADSVSFLQVSYSYNTLNREMQEKLYPIDSLAGLGIDEKENCIFIEAVRGLYPDPEAFAKKMEGLLSVPCRIEWLDNYPVTANDETMDAPAADNRWTDPETGYVYEDGVNVTVQGDIMLLSEEGEGTPVAPGNDSGESWTDPETGYVYEDGVNVTTQGDIMLLSEDGGEAPPVQSVPKTGVSFAGLEIAAAVAAAAALLKKLRNS